MSITDEHIKGFSVYKVEGDKIMHHLYVKDAQSNFSEIENVKVSVPFVTINHIFYYLTSYVFTDAQTDVREASSIVLFGDFGLETHKNIKKYENTPMKYEVKVIYPLPPQLRGCELCSGSPEYSCMPDPGGAGAYCNDGAPMPDCQGNEMSRMGISQWNEIYNPDLIHSFRDNVLSNSAKGREYINNYYYLSGVWKGKTTISLGFQSAVALVKFTTVMVAFLNPADHMLEVMFTPNLSNSLINLTNSYKEITNTEEGIEILNSIQADIRTLRNKKLEEILAMVE